MRLFLAAFFLSLPIYVLTLAPTVSGEDSGELITAAHTLGIPHPPGYPLWCVLGKLFTVVIPVGTVAYRVNLLSAVLAAAAAGVLAQVIERALLRVGLRGRGVAVAAALVFAFSRDFWAQSTIAEVYSLNILFVAALLLLVLLWDERREVRWLYLFSLLWGLGLTNHTTIAPLGAVMCAYILFRWPGVILRPSLIFTLLGLLLVGFSIFLYLPIRSLADPPMDWGNPESLESALAHVLRRQYAGVEGAGERTAANQLALLGSFVKDFSMQFTPALLPAVVLGAWRGARRDPRAFLLLGALFLLASYGIIWLFHYPAVREDLVIKRTFYLPAHLLGAVWAGMGLAVVLEWAARLGRVMRGMPYALPAIRGAVCALVAVLPLLWHYRENDRSGYYYADDLGRNILRTLPEDALIVPSADHTTFPLIYLTAVEGLRPDVLIADKYGYVEDDLLEAVWREGGKDASAPPLDGTRAEKVRYLVKESGRPAFFTVKQDLRPTGYRLAPYGLLFKAVRPGEEPEAEELEELWSRYSWREGTFTRAARDYSADMVLCDYHFARARHLIELDRGEEAIAEVSRAASYGWGIKEVLNNLGGYLSESGFHSEAIPYLKAAWRVQPGYATALRNLVLAYFYAGSYAEGYPWFEFQLRKGREDALTLLAAARGAKAVGQKHVAAGYYIRLGRRKLSDPEIYAEIVEHLESVEWAGEYIAEFEKRKEALRKEPDRLLTTEGGPPGIELLPENLRGHLPEDVFPQIGSGTTNPGGRSFLAPQSGAMEGGAR